MTLHNGVVGLLAGLMLVSTAPLHLGFAAHPALEQRPRPDVIDTSTDQASAQGHFQVSYQSRAVPVPIGQFHAWVVNVRDAQGRPVARATLGVDGDMPEHGHGLPSRPRVTQELGDGDYLVEGLRFQMPGWWVVVIDVEAGGVTDAVVFNLQLGGESATLAAQDHSMHSGAQHAGHLGAPLPVGVMATHTHDAGGWMISYRYMPMFMQGNRDGSDGVSTQEVLADYMVAPREMTMQMHMFGAMYAPISRLTLMAMVPYVDLSMDHVTRMGAKFTTEARGLGDAKLSGIATLWRDGGQQVLFSLGVSFPTGSIDEKDDTPAGHVQLPYPMQLGSGTYDLLPGVGYIGMRGAISWGAQLHGTYHLGENDRDYRLGHQFGSTLWGDVRWNEWVDSSARFAYLAWGDVEGEDDDLNPTMVPTADPDLRAGRRLDFLVGIGLEAPRGWLQGHRLTAEVGVPLVQHLDGPQLETDWTVQVGWQKTFH